MAICREEKVLIKLTLIVLFCWAFSPNAEAQTSLNSLEESVLLGDGDDSASYESAQPADQQRFESEESRREDLDEDDLEEIEQAIIGPERIPYEQVFVVQRQFIEKAGRQEITPFFLGYQPADSFRRQFQWGFSWAYHFSESFGIEGLHAAFMTNHTTGLDDDIKASTGLLTNFGTTPVVVLGSSLLYTPFRSKSATRSSVYHFDTYLSAGGGAAFAETSTEAVGIFGLGFRAYLNKRSLLKLELRDYMQFGGASSHRVSLVVGGAILL